MMNDTLTREKMSTEERASDSTTVFGFWMYLMTDFVLFASLFAVFVVLRGNIFGGSSPRGLFDMSFVLIETLALLTSSFTFGLALLSVRAGKTREVIMSLCATGVLGIIFVSMEISEFVRLIASGNGPDQSGFLSAFFTLVGTHGLHITAGLFWIGMLMISILRCGLTRANMRKLMLLGMFWHFLDIVWIFIFTIVYLMGTV